MKKIWILFVAVFLSGCLGGRSQAPHLYSIEPSYSNLIDSSFTGAVMVSGVQLPKYMDKPQMVLFDDNKNQVVVLEKERWADSLSNLMKRALTQDLSHQFPKALIKQKSLAQENFDYYLFLDISELKFILGDQASMSGWWFLRSTKGKVVLREKIDISVPLKNDYSDIALQQGKMLGVLSEQMALKIQKLK